MLAFRGRHLAFTSPRLESESQEQENNDLDLMSSAIAPDHSVKCFVSVYYKMLIKTENFVMRSLLVILSLSKVTAWWEYIDIRWVVHGGGGVMGNDTSEMIEESQNLECTSSPLSYYV